MVCFQKWQEICWKHRQKKNVMPQMLSLINLVTCIFSMLFFYFLFLHEIDVTC